VNSSNRAINADAKSAEAYSMRGLAYGAKGNVNQALADESKAIELNSNLAIAYQRRAAAYMAKKEPVKAVADLEKAISLDQNLVDALCDRAYLYALNRDPAKAMADLDLGHSERSEVSRKHTFKKAWRCWIRKKLMKPLPALIRPSPCRKTTLQRTAIADMLCTVKRPTKRRLKNSQRRSQRIPEFVAAYSGRNQSYKRLKMTTEASADAAKVRELTPEPPKKTDDKKKEDPPPRFLVKSKARRYREAKRYVAGGG
jgi:tetratricopeptide (TPR) repeat protein